MNVIRILDRVESLDTVMPEFQREYVWKLDDAKQLIISLYKEYPTGCLLFWETENPPTIKNNALRKNRGGMTEVILDGQQRLTTLYLLIKGKIPPYYTEKDFDKNDPRHLYYNVHNEEFQFYQKTVMDSNPLWVKLTDVFSNNKINASNISKEYIKLHGGDFENMVSSIIDNLNKIKAIEKFDYAVLTVPNSASIDEAIDVFDKVNSQGTKLTDAELVLTHFTGIWPDTRRVIKEKLLLLETEGFSFSLDFFTRLLVIKLTGSALLKKNSKLKYNLYETPQLQQAWDEVSKSLDFLIPILKQDAFINSTNDLNTNNVIIPIISYLLHNNIRFVGDLKYKFIYWMYLALIWQRYSGQTDQKLDKDVNIIHNSNNLIVDLINEIEDQRGRIEVKASDLEGRGAGHSLYRMLYIVTKANKAVDWANGGSIYSTIGDYYSIQSHHVFPQDFLYKNGFDSNNHLDKKRVNEIANRAFITRDTNYKISNQDPTIYLPKIIEEYPNALEKQFIDNEPDLWKIEHFDKFLQKRREKIAIAINEFLDKYKNHEATGIQEYVAKEKDWGKIIENGESNFLEFKSTLRYCLTEKKVMDYIEFSVLKTINAFLNSQGGTLLIGVDDKGEILGLDSDFNTFGDKGSDGFLLHLDNIINRSMGKDSQADINIEIIKLENKDVAVIEVSASNKAVYITNKKNKEFYVRQSASSVSYDISESHEYITKHWS